MDSIIRVEGLSKCYLLRHQAPQAREGMRHVVQRKLTTTWRAVAERLGRGQRAETSGRISDLGLMSSSPVSATEEFWALKDVSFEVKRGEVVGIIGRNGAGKSTLLKVLSRITEPTKGRVELDGRVASLLEVGTGFHPELTGRENIYINGTILGMSRAEVRRKFDEIVAFAEVEKFLDTPVKRYSSGMHVRLAFAVAAHLEPEILIVDEVLAVGDAEFQKKCLGKMGQVSRNEGRTVLFVSHNLAAVTALCNRGIVLKEGEIVCNDTANIATRSYGLGILSEFDIQYVANKERPSITRISINEQKAKNGEIELILDFVSPFELQPIPGLIIYNATGTPIYETNARMHGIFPAGLRTKKGSLQLSVESLPIFRGTYSISVWLGDWHKDYDEKLDAMKFEFGQKDNIENAPPPERSGPVNWKASWSVVERDVGVGH
jgi:lipopolysaccharide transport system ATP-binding protein